MASALDKLADNGGTSGTDDPYAGATLFYKHTIFAPSPRPTTRPDAPRVIRENDISRPADIPRAEVRRAMLPVDETGQRFQAADVKYLRRFARLPIPTRRMWAGRHEYFTQAARTFARYNLTQKKGRANAWAAGFTLADRLAFADQFDVKHLSQNTPARTSPTHSPNGRR
jgi:hypothetical protein